MNGPKCICSRIGSLKKTEATNILRRLVKGIRDCQKDFSFHDRLNILGFVPFVQYLDKIAEPNGLRPLPPKADKEVSEIFCDGCVFGGRVFSKTYCSVKSWFNSKTGFQITLWPSA